MQIQKLFISLIVVSALFLGCDNKDDKPIAKIIEMPASDSISMHVMQTFALPYLANMKFDSSSLVFYCSRAYDTSSLIVIKQQNNLIRGVYYEILPEYHRFVTDYADTSSKAIFFEGFSFIIDTVAWKSLTDLATVILQGKDSVGKDLKYADGASYALYYGGQSRHGNSNNEAPYENFDKFLKSQFLWKYKQFHKPIMFKKK